MCVGGNSFEEDSRKYAVTKFAAGDVVKITRAAKSRENGWPTMWMKDMDKFVGKTGTVTSQNRYGTYVRVEGSDETYIYPEFILLKVGAEPASDTFKVGDKVRVKVARGGPYAGVSATIVSGPDGDDGYQIQTFDARGSYFYGKNLELIPTKKEDNKLKVGDRVEVKYGHGWDGIGTIDTIQYGIYVVKFDSGRRGGFDLIHLTRLNEEPKTDNTDKRAFVIATAVARELAKSKGKVTADQVQAELENRGFNSKQLGNAAGAIFRSKQFRKIGETRSTRPSNRGRKISEWELVSA